MTGWTALVPIKEPEARKTRLATALNLAERHRLTAAMLHHVLSVLDGCEVISEVVVLSSERPEGWQGRWVEDLGFGLNPELARVAEALAGPLLVIHADLPSLVLDDVIAMTDAAQHGVAVAPDHLGTGTNALAALSSRELAFRFGPGSFAKHCTHYGARAVRVDRRGIASDIDNPADLAAQLTR